MRKLIFAVFVLIASNLLSQTLPIVEWSQTYSFGSAKSVIKTDDNSYIIVGHNGEYYWSGNYYYLKITSTGELVWANTNDINSSVARSIKKSNSGNYFITGSVEPNAFIESINSDGESLLFYTSDYANGNDIAISPSNNLLIAFESVEGYVSYTDEQVNPIWTNMYPYFSIDNSSCTNVKFLQNNNILIAGTSSEYVASTQFVSNFLIKADSLGNELWTFDNEFVSGNNTNPSKAVITDSGDFVFTAENNKLFKISSGGEMIWESETLDYFCKFSSIKTKDYNGEQFYYVVANTSGNYHLLKFDDFGTIMWDQAFEFDSSDSIFDFIIDEDNSFLLVGNSNNQFHAVKLSCETSNYDDTAYYDNSVQLLQNYPNPFNPTTIIEFSIQNDSNVEIAIFNVKGQKIKIIVNSRLLSGINQVIWNGTDNNNNFISSGIYYYKLVVNGKTKAVKKCILMK